MSDHVVSIKLYVAIFACLIALTTLTVWVAFIDLGLLNTIAALSIAVIKATLVVLYFMHVRYGNRLTWVFVSAGLIWLVILLVLLMSDYASRSWQSAPQGWL
ncbi:MAG: cytochrome C oxidase subunit IV family protein [Acidobacteriota bacterium]